MVGSVARLGAVGATVNMVEDAFWDDFLDGWDKIAEITFLWEFCTAINVKVYLVSFLVLILCRD